jgi:hypothetical protein
MLPGACRHFPRVVLRDARGTLIALSHFCPTAAGLLVDAKAPASIVEARPPLDLEEPLEGLDARDALPPLLRPGMLMDADSYGLWEETALRTFERFREPADALAAIAKATEAVRSWTPLEGPLSERIPLAFADERPLAFGRPSGFEIALTLTGPHPLMQKPPHFERSWALLLERHGEGLRRPMARFMAASTFGNWMAYRGEGLRTIVEWLHACYEVMRTQLVREVAASADVLDTGQVVEAFRMADFLLVHTIDSLQFGRAASAIERRGHA